MWTICEIGGNVGGELSGGELSRGSCPRELSLVELSGGNCRGKGKCLDTDIPWNF